MIQVPENILMYIILAVIVIFILLLIRLEIKIKNLLGGTNAKNIEQSLVVLREEIKSMQVFSEKASIHFQSVEKRLRKSIQSVETVRFNPFKGTGAGGNQSFSTAFLNEQGNGVVISSLHSRDRISIFSKPVKNFVSEFEMSGEEKDVVRRAKVDIKS
ncbi:DUF4446 family protein [Candidatus Parcubacteria bacterium]|nr:DUF4446 family protein [Candidatus Parcubacteria bacterium]